MLGPLPTVSWKCSARRPLSSPTSCSAEWGRRGRHGNARTTRRLSTILLRLLQQVGEHPLGVLRPSGEGACADLRRFAGPGVYSGGESGSPLILIRALCTNPNLRERWSAVHYELQFVEKDPARAPMLQAQVRGLRGERCGAAADGRERVRVDRHVRALRGQRSCSRCAGPSALFLFLDPFGYSHAPMTLTQDLVQQPKSDTLIFLPLSFVNRFAGREGQEHGSRSLLRHVSVAGRPRRPRTARSAARSLPGPAARWRAGLGAAVSPQAR